MQRQRCGRRRPWLDGLFDRHFLAPRTRTGSRLKGDWWKKITKYVDFQVSLCAGLCGHHHAPCIVCCGQSAFFKPKLWWAISVFSDVCLCGSQRPEMEPASCECGRWWHFILRPCDLTAASRLDEQPVGPQRRKTSSWDAAGVMSSGRLEDAAVQFVLEWNGGSWHHIFSQTDDCSSLASSCVHVVCVCSTVRFLLKFDFAFLTLWMLRCLDERLSITVWARWCRVMAQCVYDQATRSGSHSSLTRFSCCSRLGGRCFFFSFGSRS